MTRYVLVLNDKVSHSREEIQRSLRRAGFNIILDLKNSNMIIGTASLDVINEVKDWEEVISASKDDPSTFY